MDLEDFQPQLALEDARIAVDRDTRRIAVRVARWDEVHSGFGEKVRIPRKVNVDAAHVGTASLADGSKLRVATLPMDTMHAPRDLASLHAAAWYENTGKGIAQVRYSIDAEGIRADGVLFSDVDDAALERVLAASASGDWRAAAAIKRFSDFENVPADFVGSCIVNIPGYSDTFSKGEGRRMSLVASATGEVHTLVASAHTILTIIEPAGTAVTAASVGIDGISDQDVRNAWQELYRLERKAPVATGVDQPCCDGDYSYVREFYAEPRKVIVDILESSYEIPWGVAADGTIIFGDRTEVEQLWVPKGATVMGDTLTAGGDNEDKPTVTLSASALEALTGTDEEAKVAALEEAQTALVAGGHVAAPDPQAAQLGRIETMLTAIVFAQEDD